MITVFRNRKVKKINRALDINLQQWQIDYIFSNYPNVQTLLAPGRSSGKSLAIMLRQMLDTKSKYLWTLGKPLTPEELKEKHLTNYMPIFVSLTRPSIRGKNYLLKWRQIYRRLEDAGLKLAKVIWLTQN